MDVICLKSKKIEKAKNIKLEKINVFFKKSILESILKILTMKHAGFRTIKSVKNINRLFAHINLSKYRSNKELEAYIWCISYISKKWLDGIVTIDIIYEMAKRETEFDSIKDKIISNSINDENPLTPPEAKMIFNLITEALQYGFVTTIREDYLNLLEDIDLSNPGAFRELMNRLFTISKSLIDIQYNTNLVSNQLTFDTSDVQSIKDALHQTIDSLSGSGSMLKTGIVRLNTLLSPAYMKGRLYVYIGPPGSFKSGILLKSALDIRKYNPDYEPKTPGMRPCVLYITMENTFTETIERIWNMTFDDPITNYSEEEAFEKLADELGFDLNTTDSEDNGELQFKDKNTMELVIKYFPYREISTDDLFTIIQDLREENKEVCALVFDYIKRIRPAQASANDTVKTELSRIVNELKAIGVIDDIAVITGHQSNRVGVSAVDNAMRQGKGDATKLLGREHSGDAFEVIECADWVGMNNIEYKPGTDQKYFCLNIVKRRRIDSAESEFAKYTYLAHPFAPTNGLRLIDDAGTGKILSLKSLVNDFDVTTEKTNAVPRLKNLPDMEYDD